MLPMDVDMCSVDSRCRRSPPAISIEPPVLITRDFVCKALTCVTTK